MCQPKRRSFAITPGVDLPEPATQLYFGTGGDITLKLLKDTNSITLKAVPQGTILNLVVVEVSEGPTDLVGFSG